MIAEDWLCVGTFTPYEWANAPNQGLFSSRELVVKYLPAFHCSFKNGDGN